MTTNMLHAKESVLVKYQGKARLQGFLLRAMPQ